jgi:hypothetical protein
MEKGESILAEPQPHCKENQTLSRANTSLRPPLPTGFHFCQGSLFRFLRSTSREQKQFALWFDFLQVLGEKRFRIAKVLSDGIKAYA